MESGGAHSNKPIAEATSNPVHCTCLLLAEFPSAPGAGAVTGATSGDSSPDGGGGEGWNELPGASIGTDWDGDGESSVLGAGEGDAGRLGTGVGERPEEGPGERVLEIAVGAGEEREDGGIGNIGVGLAGCMIGPEEDDVGEGRETGEREDTGGDCGARTGGEMWAEGPSAAGVAEGLVDGGADRGGVVIVGVGVLAGDEPNGASPGGKVEDFGAGEYVLLGATVVAGGADGELPRGAVELFGGIVDGEDGDADLGPSGIDIVGGTLGGVFGIDGDPMGENIGEAILPGGADAGDKASGGGADGKGDTIAGGGVGETGGSALEIGGGLVAGEGIV